MPESSPHEVHGPTPLKAARAARMIAGIGDLGSDDLSLSGTEYSNSNFPEWNLVVWNRKANCFAIYDLQDSQLCKSLTWLFQGGEKNCYCESGRRCYEESETYYCCCI